MDMDRFGEQPSTPRLDTNTAAPVGDNITAETNASAQQIPATEPQPLTPLQSDQPINLPTDSDKSPMKMIIAIVAALALAGLAFFGGYMMGKSAGFSEGQRSEQAKFQEQVKKEAETKKAEESKKLDLGELIEPQYKDETIDGEIGQQVASSDGFVMMVKNVERNYKTTDPNFKTDPANELIKVNFIMGNSDKNKPKDISPASFRLENSAAAQLMPESTIASYEGKFDTVKLQPGDQLEKSIVYLVKKDEKNLKFLRSQIYRVTNQNKEFTTKIVIKL